jgi:hypothetical protein
MNTITIGESERDLSNASESWINQQIHQRQEDGISVCVQIRIQTSSLELLLSTPGCNGSGGGWRQPSAKEAEVIEIWTKRGLNSSGWTSGNVIAFLKQIRGYL